MDKIESYLYAFLQTCITFAPRLVGALVVLVIGLWLINWLTRLTTRALNSRGLDISLQSFLSSLLNIGLKILLLVTVAGMLGLQTTSFVAILGAAGLAVGLALQGSLSNFAGGVLTLVFKPYKVGDLIEAQGQNGVVKEIQIFNTILLTAENKTVILPNGAVSNGTIINYSNHGNLRVDITIGVAPENDIAKVRAIIQEIFNANEFILKTPAASTNILKMADGSVVLGVRPYTTPDHYWDVFFAMQEQIKLAFEKNAITAPAGHQIIINNNKD